MEEIGDFLRNKGFSENVIDCFKGQLSRLFCIFVKLNISEEEEMDGLAIAGAFGSLPGPDGLKDVVSKYVTRIKVYSALKTLVSVYCY